MNVTTTDYHDSALTKVYPWGRMMAAHGALCPDGKRRNAFPSGDGFADTVFSIPAFVYANHRRVYGYVTVECVSGSSVETPDDPATVKFVPYRYRKHAALVS